MNALQITHNENDLYKPSDELLAAINTALFLRRPLLLSGDPGTGKTECADFIARQLKTRYPDLFGHSVSLRFNTKSVSQSTDLFYQYDAIAHFADKENRSKESFINFNSMGLALIATQPVQEIFKKFAKYDTTFKEEILGRGSVVLIDEIDKAPRDFPNDLLAELEKPPFKFSIKELPEFEVKQNPERPVIVVITSNSEKGLPDAFLRRCVYHNISFPSPEVLLRIVEAKFGQDSNFKAAIQLFFELRSKKNINKLPATSELVDWITCLRYNDLLGNLGQWQGADTAYRKRLADTLGVIAKSRSDFENMKKEIAG